MVVLEQNGVSHCSADQRSPRRSSSHMHDCVRDGRRELCPRRSSSILSRIEIWACCLFTYIFFLPPARTSPALIIITSSYTSARTPSSILHTQTLATMVYVNIFSVAFISLLTARIGSAVPMPSLETTGSLSKRDGVVFQDCGDVNDDRRQKAEKAWSEAADLAAFTVTGTLDDGTMFKGTDA